MEIHVVCVGSVSTFNAFLHTKAAPNQIVNEKEVFFTLTRYNPVKTKRWHHYTPPPPQYSVQYGGYNAAKVLI